MGHQRGTTGATPTCQDAITESAQGVDVTRKARAGVVLWALALWAVTIWQVARGNGVFWMVYAATLLIGLSLMRRSHRRQRGRR